MHITAVAVEPDTKNNSAKNKQNSVSAVHQVHRSGCSNANTVIFEGSRCTCGGFALVGGLVVGLPIAEQIDQRRLQPSRLF